MHKELTLMKNNVSNYNFEQQREFLIADFNVFKLHEKKFTLNQLEKCYKDLNNTSNINVDFTPDRKRCFYDMVNNGDLVDCGNGYYKFSDSLLRDTAPLLRQRPKSRKWK